MDMKRLFAIVLLALAAEEAGACSCIGPRPPDEAFASATHVFEGKVVAVSDQYTLFRKAWDVVGETLDRQRDWNSYARTHGFKVVFEVTRSWKGSLKKRFVLYTGRGGGDCGYPFKTGQVYVVYAYCDAAYCETNICTRTRLRAAAAEDLKYLATLPAKTP
jgi:hypothetical protein